MKPFQSILLLIIFTSLTPVRASDFSQNKNWKLYKTYLEEKITIDNNYEQNNIVTTIPNYIKKPHVVFLISKDPDNYEAHKTIPQFASMLAHELGYKVTVILGEGDLTTFNFPGLEVLSEANLLVIFFRRIALPHEQMGMIKSYLEEGKPLVAIRTANHAFSVREEVPNGYESWWDFVPNILGCINRGYGSSKLGTEVAVVPEFKVHSILKEVEPMQWHSKGNLYHVAPLIDKEAAILLTGKAGDKIEPIAWTRRAYKSKVFYTSLGYPTDFQLPQFQKLLLNGIQWALE